MDLNQLEYFKALADIKHFTQAAQNIAVSQPALSRSIAKLERELGLPLFNRSGKTIKLTQYGEIFLSYVERSLQEITNGKQALANLSNPNKGTIRLSFLHSLGSYLIPVLLSSFRRQYPQIQFKLDQNNSALLTKQLLDGDADLCICSTLTSTNSLSWITLGSEELFVVVPHNHRLAKRQSIRLAEIAQEPLITFKKPMYGLRLLADRFFEAANIRPKITFEGDEIMTVAGLVDANLGVALIPHIPGLEHFNIVFIPVEVPICTRPIGIAWNTAKYLSPAAKNFHQFVVRSFQNNNSSYLSPYCNNYFKDFNS